ncbi:MAG: hypothetical protein JSW09_01665 [Pseudomonadota bacterium]|nr:MAG: hypothetical protein JSW09_01665 [Pseudomonadota bacterium]
MKSRAWPVMLLLMYAVGSHAAPATPSSSKDAADAIGDAAKTEAKPKSAPPAREPAPPPVRGQLLYEHHCTSCHESTVHVREKRRAKSINDLRGWAIHWSNHLKLNWTTEEVDDVVRYLNGRYYLFKSEAK